MKHRNLLLNCFIVLIPLYPYYNIIIHTEIYLLESGTSVYAMSYMLES